MKFVVAVAGCFLILQSTLAAFNTVNSAISNKKLFVLYAAEDDLPDIVKAYSKASTATSTAATSAVASNPPTPTIDPSAVSAVAVTDISAPPVQADAATSIDAMFDGISGSALKGQLAESAGIKLDAVNDFLKTAQTQYQDRISTLVESPRLPGNVPSLGESVGKIFSASRIQITPPEFPPLAEGKVPTLAGYIQRKVVHAPLPHDAAAGESIANMKAKFALLVANTYALLGKEAPDMSAFSLTVPEIQKLSLQGDVPDGSIGWAFAAVAILVAAGQRRAGIADARLSMDDFVSKESLAVKELAEQMVRTESF